MRKRRRLRLLLPERSRKAGCSGRVFTRALPVSFLLVLLLLPAPAAADEEPVQECQEAALRSWTRQETWIWGQLCARRTADLSTSEEFGTAGDVLSSEGWSPFRIVRSSFVEAILTEPTLVERLPARSVDIRGALFPEPLNLSDASTPSIYFFNSRFENSVNLMDADVAGSISFDGSAVEGEVAAHRLAVEGSILMRGGRYQDIGLLGAHSEGGLELSDSTVAGKLSLGGAEIAGGLQLNRGTFQDIDLVGAKVAQALTVRNSSTRDLLLDSATIESFAALDHSTISGIFDASGVIIGNGFFAVDAVFKDTLWLDTAQIKDQVNLGGAEMYGAASMNGTVVDGTLVLVSDKQATWHEGASLDLGGASLKGIDDGPESWPSTLNLAGLGLGQAQGRLGEEGSFTDRPATWYMEWLERDAAFPRQAYSQVETLLRSAGRRGEANSVGVERAAREYSSGSVISQILGPIHRETVGFGYRPERAILWAVLLVLLGWAVAQHIPQKCLDDVGASSRLILSVHRLIPLISFGKAYADVDVTSRSVPPLVRWYFYAHAVLGFVLAAALVSAIAGVTSITGGK